MNFRKFSLRPMQVSRWFSGVRWHDVKASLGVCVGRFRSGDFSVKAWSARMPKWQMQAEHLSRWVSALLLMLICGIAVFWLLRIIQIPFPLVAPAKGVVFYEAGSSQSARALFGEKTFDASRLVLRGLVITGSESGAQQGIALIEVDGKPAEAISVGEIVPPGIRLEKIQPDGVVVTYQGKEISLQQSFDKASGKTP